MEKQIKYSYCVDENNRLVHISELTKETRHSHQWRCLQCGQILIPNLGEKNRWHFSHKADTACDGETDLHKLAKRKIREKFESSDSLTITFVRDVPCMEKQVCTFYNKPECKVEGVKKTINLKEWYDTCQEEATIGDFRADLLLSCDNKPQRERTLIEVCVTHQSEDRKKKSYKIIETKQIQSEKDIEDIINRGFVEGSNCEVFNFNPQMPSKRKTDKPIERFVLFKSGAAMVYKAYEYKVLCDKLNERVRPYSVCELNMKESDIELMRGKFQDNPLDSDELDFKLGLIYLIKKKNWLIKNCFLCEFRKIKVKGRYSTYVCTHDKNSGPQYIYPKQSMAENCIYYQIDQELIDKYPLSELEKSIDPNIIE